MSRSELCDVFVRKVLSEGGEGGMGARRSCLVHVDVVEQCFPSLPVFGAFRVQMEGSLGVGDFGVAGDEVQGGGHADFGGGVWARVEAFFADVEGAGVVREGGGDVAVDVEDFPDFVQDGGEGDEVFVVGWKGWVCEVRDGALVAGLTKKGRRRLGCERV